MNTPKVLSFLALILIISNQLAFAAEKAEDEGKLMILNYENSDCTGDIQSTLYATENCYANGGKSIKVFCSADSIYTQTFPNENCEGTPSHQVSDDFNPNCFAGVKAQCSSDQMFSNSGHSMVIDFYSQEGCAEGNLRASLDVSTDECAFTGSEGVYVSADCEDDLATINYYSDPKCENIIEGADTLQIEDTCTAVLSSPSGSFQKYGAYLKLRECKSSSAAALRFSFMFIAVLGAVILALV